MFTLEVTERLDAQQDVCGETAFDIYLNVRACGRNVPVPANVWICKLGGYQVLKKWLSYREHGIPRRALSPEEVQHFTETAQRIGALLQATHDTPVKQ